MKERNMTISIVQARNWFNSGNKQLQELALQVFDRKELTSDFRHIVTFEDACEVLGLRYSFSRTDSIIRTFSRSTSAMYKLNIIRRALNLGQELSFARGSSFYYPTNPFVTENSVHFYEALKAGKMEVIGKIKSEGIIYKVLSGLAYNGSGSGLASRQSFGGLCNNNCAMGFLGCASKEIAEHFGKYFGMLITTAKYADIIKDFEVIESKYII